MCYFSHSPKTCTISLIGVFKVPRHVRACCDELGTEPRAISAFSCLILCGFCFICFSSAETPPHPPLITTIFWQQKLKDFYLQESEMYSFVILSITLTTSSANYIIISIIFLACFLLHVLFCHLHQHMQSCTLRVTSPLLRVRNVSLLWDRSQNKCLHFIYCFSFMCRAPHNTLPLYSLSQCSETANVGSEVVGHRLKIHPVSGSFFSLSL